MLVTLVEADGKKREFRIDGRRATIGRSGDNDIFVADPALSRCHAELEEDDAGWSIVDRGSKNGTFVNERRVSARVRLTAGDRIALGTSQLIFGATGPPSVIVQESDSATEERTVGSLRVGDSRETTLMRILVDAAREIASHRSGEDMLQRLLDLAVRATHAERGMIARQAADGALTPLVWISPPGGGPPVMSRRVLQRVLSEGEALNLEDLPEELALQGTILGAGIRSILCSPLGSEKPFRGVLYLDTVRTRADFKQSHLEVVATLAGMVDVVLETTGVREQRERLRLMEAQLQAAAEIQAALLPPADVANPRGLCAAGSHRACLTVGGDLFDFFGAGEKLGLMLADVAGKGMSAALLMAGLHARWRGLRLLGTPPTEWLCWLNDEFQTGHPGNRFITLAFAIADPDRDELFFASAGHNPAFLVHGERIEELDSTGPILGILPSMEFGSVTCPFPQGARLVLYSDGVTDQQDGRGVEFGLDRLRDSVTEGRTLPPRELVDKIREDLERHAGEAPQDDDITIAVIGRS